MNTKDLVEKIKSHPIPFISGFVILASLLALYFRMDVIGDLETQYEEISAQGELMTDNLLKGGKIEEDLKSLQVLTEDIESRLVDPVELAKNLQYFYRLEGETGAKISGLKQNRVEKNGKDRSYVGVSYSVDITGRFGVILAYLKKLETGPLFCRINSFSTNRSQNGPDYEVNAAIELELLGIQ
jgi:hypothetical protein